MSERKDNYNMIKKTYLFCLLGFLAILISLVPVEIAKEELPALASTWVDEWTTIFGKKYRTRVETYHWSHETYDPVYYEIDMWDERGNTEGNHHSTEISITESLSIGGTGVYEAMVDLVGNEYSNSITKGIDGNVSAGKCKWVYLEVFEKNFQYVQQVYHEKVVNGNWTEVEDYEILWPTVNTIQENLRVFEYDFFD